MPEHHPPLDQQPSAPDRLRIGTVADIMKGSQSNPHIQRAIDQIRQGALPDVLELKMVASNIEPLNPDLPPDGSSDI